MKVISVRDYIDLTDVNKNLIDSFYDGKHFDIFKAAKIFEEDPIFFQEDTITKGIYRQASKLRQKEYLEHIALFRYQTIYKLDQISYLRGNIVEFFDEYCLVNSSPIYLDLISEYRSNKKKAYALLY